MERFFRRLRPTVQPPEEPLPLYAGISELRYSIRFTTRDILYGQGYEPMLHVDWYEIAFQCIPQLHGFVDGFLDTSQPRMGGVYSAVRSNHPSGWKLSGGQYGLSLTVIDGVLPVVQLKCANRNERRREGLDVHSLFYLRNQGYLLYDSLATKVMSK